MVGFFLFKKLNNIAKVRVYYDCYEINNVKFKTDAQIRQKIKNNSVIGKS